MKLEELEAKLRTRDPDAPSDLELDRLATGALDEDEAREVEARALRSMEAQARLAERRRGLEAFPDVDERAMLARVRRELAARPKSLAERLRALLPLAPLLAAAAALLVILPRYLSDSGPASDATLDTDVVRSKGGIALEVLRRRGERAESVPSGSTFKAGDELRFRVSLPTAVRVAILGVEGTGALYTAWPLQAHDADDALPAGKDQLLPGAVVLDDTAGRETLHLVACPTAITPTCESGGAEAPPRCPDGCLTTPFVLNKQP